MEWYNQIANYVYQNQNLVGLGAFTLFGAGAGYVFCRACNNLVDRAGIISRKAATDISLQETREGRGNQETRQTLDLAVSLGELDQEEAHLAIIEGKRIRDSSNK